MPKYLGRHNQSRREHKSKKRPGNSKKARELKDKLGAERKGGGRRSARTRTVDLTYRLAEGWESHAQDPRHIPIPPPPPSKVA